MRSDSGPAPAGPLRALLTADLLHATEYMRTESGFRLKTLASLDGATLELHHLPAEVEYRMERVGSRKWLLRLQSPLIQGTDQRELVCQGVASVQLEVPLPPGRPEPLDSAQGWQPVWAEAIATVLWDANSAATECAVLRN